MAQEEVEWVRKGCILGRLVTRLIIERFGPGVRSQDGESMAVALIERYLKRIVRRVEAVEEAVDSRKTLDRSSFVNRGAVFCQSEIGIVNGSVLVVLSF